MSENHEWMGKWVNHRKFGNSFSSSIFQRLECQKYSAQIGQNDPHSTFQVYIIIPLTGPVPVTTLSCPGGPGGPLWLFTVCICALWGILSHRRARTSDMHLAARPPVASDVSKTAWPTFGARIGLEVDSSVQIMLVGGMPAEQWFSHHCTDMLGGSCSSPCRLSFVGSDYTCDCHSL